MQKTREILRLCWSLGRTVRQTARGLGISSGTVSLAEGETETWVADKTGHMSTQMIALYRRWSRTHIKRKLGRFKPLHLAIPELRRLGSDDEHDGGGED